MIWGLATSVSFATRNNAFWPASGDATRERDIACRVSNVATVEVGVTLDCELSKDGFNFVSTVVLCV